MDKSRRRVLQGMGASGLAFAVPVVGKAAPGTASATAQEQLTLYVMASPHADPSGFEAGALAAGRRRGSDPNMVHELRSGLALDDISRFNSLLHQPEAARVIGLVDDASAAVLVNMARAAYVRMHWLAQHRVTPSGVKHTVVAAVDDACCEQMARGLTAGRAPILHDRFWTQQLGYSLTRLHAQSAPARAWTATSSAPEAGSFFSFSFDTQGTFHG